MGQSNFFKQIVLVQLVVVVIFVRSGSTIMCYTCDSTRNPGCTTLKKGSGIRAEKCTLDKMNEIDTWLTDLAKVSYFHGTKQTQHDVPMYCQKVVGTKENGDPVTARFCQLHTVETHPCTIPLDKIKNDNSIEIQHCSICDSDYCNEATSLRRIGHTKIVMATIGAIFLRLFL